MTLVAKRLVFAREYVGLTPEKVCQLTEISIQRLVSLESGEDSPTDAELLLFEKLYHYPALFLAGKEELPIPTVVAVPRAKSNTSQKDERELAAFAQFLMVAGRAK